MPKRAALVLLSLRSCAGDRVLAACRAEGATSAREGRRLGLPRLRPRAAHRRARRRRDPRACRAGRIARGWIPPPGVARPGRREARRLGRPGARSLDGRARHRCAAPKVRVLELGDRVPTIARADGSIDPYPWMDPQRARLMATAIAEDLARTDSSHAAAFRDRASALDAALDALDHETEDATAALARSRPFARRSRRPRLLRGTIQASRSSDPGTRDAGPPLAYDDALGASRTPPRARTRISSARTRRRWNPRCTDGKLRGARTGNPSRPA